MQVAATSPFEAEVATSGAAVPVEDAFNGPAERVRGLSFSLPGEGPCSTWTCPCLAC